MRRAVRSHLKGLPKVPTQRGHVDATNYYSNRQRTSQARQCFSKATHKALGTKRGARVKNADEIIDEHGSVGPVDPALSPYVWKITASSGRRPLEKVGHVSHTAPADANTPLLLR